MNFFLSNCKSNSRRLTSSSNASTGLYLHYIIDYFKNQERIAKLRKKITLRDKNLPRTKNLIENPDHLYNHSVCGTYITIHDNNTISINNQCRNRICPVCNWLNSSSRYALNKRIVGQLIDNDYHCIFATFTILNMTADELSKSITLLTNSFNRLINHRTIKDRICGYYRTIEVTYNVEDKTYHPHIHSIIVVPNNYYVSENYIPTWEFRELWQKIAKLDYVAQVDVVPLEDEPGAIAEVSKYSLKIANVLNELTASDSVDVAKVIYNCVGNRRLVSSGGLFAKYKKLLKAQIKDEFKQKYNVEYDKSMIYDFKTKEFRKYNPYNDKLLNPIISSNL